MYNYDERELWNEICWCPQERTLLQMRLEGHTLECTEARRANKANMKHLSNLNREKKLNEEIGRQLRESAMEILARNGGPSD